MSEATADAIVIGSGFGGAVMADRLLRAGLRVIVLERGPWRRTAPVLARGLEQAAPLPVQHRPGLILRSIRPPRGPKELRFNRRGLLELHLGKGVKTLAASGVGGGSHIWSALVARPDDPVYWEGRAEGVDEAVMAPHYARVAEELGAVQPSRSESLPNHTSHAWRESGWFAPVAETEQYPFALIFPEEHGGRPVGGRQPSRLNGEDGLFGSAGAAKANVEAIYLLPHLEAGLRVHDLHEALTIMGADAGGYEVRAKDLRTGEHRTFCAPRVVLAAGTLNSVRLLFESQAAGGVSPMDSLGRGFGTNGDCLGTWIPKTNQRDSRLGSPIHGRLRLDGELAGVNLIVGGMDAVPLPTWVPGFVGDAMAAMANRRFQLIAMGVDRANGRLAYTGGRLRLEYDLRDSPVYQDAFDLFERLSERSRSPIRFDRKSAVTAHAMGGCRIGASPAEGVVDGEGRVYGNPELYVADASVLPAPTGGPPSLTLAAWSSHVAASLLNSL